MKRKIRLMVKMKEFAIIASKIKNQQKGGKMQDNLKSAQRSATNTSLSDQPKKFEQFLVQQLYIKFILIKLKKM